MAAHQALPFVFGAAYMNPGQPFDTPDKIQEVLKALKRHDIMTLDTAQLYGESERLIGENDAAGQGFAIDSKNPGGANPGQALQPESLEKGAYESAKKTGVEGKGGLDVFYVHAPDPQMPVEKWMPTMDKLHKAGVFKRLGLSNFTADGTREVYDFAEKNGFVKPTIYQGHYNALGRHSDECLLPTLRELKIAFYAYSPIAGGFLTKTPEQVKAGEGRFKKGAMAGEIYMHMFSEKDSMMKALQTWNDIADAEGVEKGELAYRWITYNSQLKPEYGDKLITGARSVQQLDHMMEWVAKGPLSPETAAKIDAMWAEAKGEAFKDTVEAHYSMMKSKPEGSDDLTDPNSYRNK